jgi:hypothetical protein
VLLKKILIIFSFLLNLIFILCILFLSLYRSRFNAVLLFSNKDVGLYDHNAFIVSMPNDESIFEFGPIEVSIKMGTEMIIQQSIVRNNRQINLAIEPLYDRSIVSIAKSGAAYVVLGISPGETTLQCFSPFQGFRDLARIYVYE